MNELYEWWRENCHPKYLHYFDLWFKNLTEYQICCYTVWMEGKLGPFF